MNPVYDFTAVDHAAMLGDLIRLELYRRAIENQVKPDSVVAEIGTGSGILSAYAAAQTKNKVSAIEFAEYSAKLAGDMMKAAGFHHVEILRGMSSDITLSPEPSILITETIGALGPEENIVEICHDFKKRHPSLKTIIPARLRIYAQPIRSDVVVDAENGFFKSYADASFKSFNFNAIRGDLNNIWTSRIRYRTLEGSENIGERTLLVEYKLGETESSHFSTDVDVSRYADCDAVHLYFETDLDGEVLLTTNYQDPETHWGNAYVSKPEGAKTLNVSFTNPSPTLVTQWKN
jgi:predicted RNA methylase